MNKKITINYFPHSRFYYVFSLIKELAKLRDETKSIIKINLLFSHIDNEVMRIRDLFQERNIEAELFGINGGDYMAKVNTAITNTQTDFFVKLDEDVFLSSDVWEYFFNNYEKLNDSNVAFMTPILSTGIPTTDSFIEQFFKEEDKKKIYDIFLKVTFGEIWGVDYSILNKFTIQASKWDSKAFYKEVANINHFYKGIHPVRLSSEAQIFITDYIINNIHKLFENKDLSISKEKFPYLCNNIVMLKTDTFKKIVDDKSLFKDGFDEVPINLYMQNNNLNMLIINNGFGVHPSYNTIGHHYKLISDRFFERINTL
jgi:hypothetical protein